MRPFLLSMERDPRCAVSIHAPMGRNEFSVNDLRNIPSTHALSAKYGKDHGKECSSCLFDSRNSFVKCDRQDAV